MHLPLRLKGHKGAREKRTFVEVFLTENKLCSSNPVELI